jgi:tripartite-type tricarboxylate transporter receptor subunit TctC
MHFPKNPSSMRRSLLATLACAPLLAAAQTGYPAREVRLIVPWNPGGSVDISARRIAKTAEADGLRLVVENIPGASGSIGLARAASAAPDGYTLAIATTSQLALVAQGLTKTRNDQFTYLNQVSHEQYLLLVPQQSPVRDIEGFLKVMKDKPGAVSIGTAGANNLPHILAASTALLSGVDYIHAPYPGGSKAIMDLAGKQIDASVLKPSEAKGQIDAGLVRPLGLYSTERLKSMPEVPTFAEKGFNVYPYGPLIQTSWLVGPANLPTEITTKLTKIFAKVMMSKEYRDFAEDNGFTSVDLQGQALKSQVDSVQTTLETVAPKIFKKQP